MFLKILGSKIDPKICRKNYVFHISLYGSLGGGGGAQFYHQILPPVMGTKRKFYKNGGIVFFGVVICISMKYPAAIKNGCAGPPDHHPPFLECDYLCEFPL